MRTRARAAVWGGALAAGVAVAALTTEFEMGVPPTRLGLAALVVAVLAVGAAALADGPRGRWATGLALAAVAVVAAQDFLRPGVVFGHDLGYHTWALFSTWRSVLDGDPWPRWNPYLGLGMPLLQFYCPVGYVAAWPAQALGASPVDALKFLVVGGQLVTVGTTYASVRWAGGSRGAGLLAACALALAPYHLMDQTFRVALGELLAFAWLPPMVVASVKMARGERGAAPWVLGVCTAGLLMTHVLSVIEIAFVLAPVTVWGLSRRVGRARPRRASWAGLGLCAVLTVSASAAWWLPVVTEQEHTAVRKLSRPGRAISAYAATFDEPVRRRAWPRYGIRYRRGDREDPGKSMPMYFGCVLLALLLVACAAPRGSSDDGPPVRALALTALVTLLFGMWPLARLLDGVPGIGRIMFPWRLYAPASVLASLSVGLALDRWLPDSRTRVVVVLAAVAALAWDVSPYLGAPDRYAPYEGFAVFRSRTTVLPTPVKPGEFVRVENAPLPPSDYDYRVALSRRVFPEYMSVRLRDDYGRFSNPPSVEMSEGFGASLRYGWGNGRQTVLDPKPLVRHRPEGGRWRWQADATWEIEPERVTVHLPEGLEAGRIRFTQGWFVGWRVRVDEGEWGPALKSKQMLAVDAPAGARTVEFRYAALRPWDRPVGMAISLLTLGGLVLGRRRRVAAPGSPG